MVAIFLFTILVLHIKLKLVYNEIITNGGFMNQQNSYQTMPAPPKPKSPGLLTLVIVSLISALVAGAIVYFIMESKNQQIIHKSEQKQEQQGRITDEPNKTSITNNSTNNNNQANADNKGYLVVKQWGLRFKIPQGLADVQYVIRGDTIGFWGKPNGYGGNYARDYQEWDNGSFEHAQGLLIRSRNGQNNHGLNSSPVSGKKIGEYYYYTAWSFSPIPNYGVGNDPEIYGDFCDDNPQTINCQNAIKASNQVFNLINNDDGLLKTIELLP